MSNYSKFFTANLISQLKDTFISINNIYQGKQQWWLTEGKYSQSSQNFLDENFWNGSSLAEEGSFNNVEIDGGEVDNQGIWI